MLPNFTYTRFSAYSRSSAFSLTFTFRLKLALALSFTFTILTALVLADRLLTLDTVLEQKISTLNLGIGINLLELAAWFGKPLGLLGSLGLSCGLLLWQRRYRFLWFVVQSAALGFLLTALLKPLFQRIRPGVDFSENLYCYPSGHTLGAVFVYGGMAVVFSLLIKKSSFRLAVQFGLILLVGLIGFSRIYYNTHYPSDVLASFLIGAIYFITIPHLQKLFPKY